MLSRFVWVVCLRVFIELHYAYWIDSVWLFGFILFDCVRLVVVYFILVLVVGFWLLVLPDCVNCVVCYLVCVELFCCFCVWLHGLVVLDFVILVHCLLLDCFVVWLINSLFGLGCFMCCWCWLLTLVLVLYCWLLCIAFRLGLCLGYPLLVLLTIVGTLLCALVWFTCFCCAWLPFLNVGLLFVCL